MIFEPSNGKSVLLNTDTINTVYCFKTQLTEPYRLEVICNNEQHQTFDYSDKSKRDIDYKRIKLLISKKEGNMKYLKEYFEKHKDSIFTIVGIILLDHFIFGGAFREKIKQMIDKIINNTSKQLTESK